MKKSTWKNRIPKTKKGSTLLELTIVLALLTIVSTLIVSFSTLVSNQVKRDKARADFISAASSCKFALQTQFAEIDNDTIDVFTVAGEDNTKLLFKNGEERLLTFDFDTYPEFHSESVDIHIGIGAEGKLLRIELENTETKQTLSFLIVSNCGATFSSETSAEGGQS